MANALRKWVAFGLAAYALLAGAAWGMGAFARETFSRIVALIDATSPEKAPEGAKIALGGDAPN